MRKTAIFIFTALLLQACGNIQEPKPKTFAQQQAPVFESYSSVGEKISAEGVLSAAEMKEKYDKLTVGDTLQVKFKADVVSVCKKKGCFMNLALGNGEEAAVKFKDYAFFVPKDIEEKEVVVDGKAFVSVVSVEDQRHYAEDEGRTEEEIAAITEPKMTLSFLADGVLIEP